MGAADVPPSHVPVWVVGAGTAYIGNSGTTVWDFGNGNNGNVYSILADRCQCYCPIQGTLQCNLQDSLCTYDYKHSAKSVHTALQAQAH